ncbi:hypothetical protein [Neisseria meningitidis]|uniref:hypothetical protein n=1 Tax=Neisseria meningitidis TaxID=487 RepID=UPI00163ED5FC|nr:hypothetical protein [Neisseria meningitidis]
MTKGCGNHGNGEVSDGIVPTHRHSRAGGNPVVIPAQAGIWNVIPAQAGIQAFGQQQYSKIIRKFEVLDSRFHGNDERLRESGLFGFGFF